MASTASADTSPLSPDEQRNLAAVTDVLPFWNRGDIPGVLSYYDERILWTNVSMEEAYSGKHEVGAYLQRMLTAFPGLRFEVSHKIARGHRVAERWVIRGTHNGPYLGIPPTGRQVAIHGMSIVHLTEGRFLSDRFYFDSGSVLRDMGLLPPPAVFKVYPVQSLLALAAAVSQRLASDSAIRDVYASPVTESSEPEPTLQEQANLATLDSLIKAFNAKRVGAIRDLIAADVTLDNKTYIEKQCGVDTVIESLEALTAAFPDAEATVVQTVVRDDVIACEFHWTGTHSASFVGVPATGRPVSMPGICMLTFADGKITDIALYADSGMLWRQLGLMPPLSFLDTGVARVSLWTAVNRVRVVSAIAVVFAAMMLLRRARRR